MAEIKVEKKERGGLARWLLPLALLALVAVAVLALRGRDDRQTVAANETTNGATIGAASGAAGTAGGEVATGSGAAASTGVLPIGAILAGPDGYASQTVSGTARVTDVISDRGFWIEDAGQRMFVVLGEKGAGSTAGENQVNVNAGQTVRLTGHVFSRADQIPGGGQLESDARQAIAGQPAFLHVNPRDVTILP